jgi:hypothetical protein
MSVLHKVRLLTSISIYKYWDVSMMHCITNCHKSGNLVRGKFTMTMNLPTQPNLCDNF